MPTKFKFLIENHIILSAFVIKDENLPPVAPTMDITLEINYKNSTLRPEVKENLPVINDMDRLNFSKFIFIVS